MMLYGIRQAVLQIIDKGSCAYAKRLDDGTWQTIEWVDIYNFLTDIIDKNKAENGQQESEEI